ncbi:hypothetical protein M8J77_023704 [Diaphorina citri]|nr:hypothetical protein M8J77_023704 [Diaphorina citri]
MIDDDPELEIFYWLDGLSDKPLKYHVTFFDSKEVSRAWISASNIKRYEPRRRSDRSIPTALRPRYNTAQDQAIQAVGEKDLLKRLRRWSFVARYRGEIRPPKPEEELMPLIRRFMRQDPSKL